MAGRLPLPPTKAFHVRSKLVGEEYRVFVGEPALGDGHLVKPVCLLDPPVGFGTALEVARLLHATGDLPPLLIVAVGYDEITFGDSLAPRQRDLTPWVSATGGTRDDPAYMGGAEAFLGFLREELKPWLRERYEYDQSDWALIGHSLGGLFATFALLTDPGCFQRYGAGSPAYWWANRAIFDYEKTRAAGREDPRGRLYISVGEHETPTGALHYIGQLPPTRRAAAERQEAEDPTPDMVADAVAMAANLRAYPNLSIECEILQDEHHQTSVPLNISRSLRRLYDPPG